MQVNLDKTFPVETPGTASWQVLSNIETVASCMPGAQITEQVDETHYKGRVKSKIGPATMAFDGTIEVLGIDPTKRELRMTSKGQDTKGSSSAQMDLTAWIVEEEDERSALKGEAVVLVNGKVASMGGRMLNQVADQILNQFGQRFADKAKEFVATAEAAAGAEGLGVEVSGSGQTETAHGATRPRSASEPDSINGIAFAWSVLVGWFKSWFGKKQANAR